MLPLRHRSIRRLRAAFTLVELLVAVAIAALLIAIAIPALKINMRGQSIREAARQINSFIDEAKSQAAGSGRPFGIVIERDGDGSYGNPSRSFRLYHCEVQPPYTGDILQSPANSDPRIRVGSRAYFEGAAGFNTTYEVYIGTVVLSFANDRMVTPGDEIAFDGSAVRYTIVSVANVTPSDLDPITTPWLLVTYAHPVAQTPSLALEMPYDNFDQTPNPLLPTDRVSAGHSFRVYRQPVKIASSVLELPRSAAIDLDWCGIGYGGSAAGDPMKGLEFSDYAGTSISPITILFEPNGNVRAVTTSWCLNADTAGPYRFALESRVIIEPIFLLVGRLDRVEDAFTPNPPPPAIIPNWTELAAEIPSNIHDNDAMWIKINPANGTTLTVQNAGVLEYLIPANAPWNRTDAVSYARQLALDSAGAGG